jgi:hypothetical protein
MSGEGKVTIERREGLEGGRGRVMAVEDERRVKGPGGRGGIG